MGRVGGEGRETDSDVLPGKPWEEGQGHSAKGFRKAESWAHTGGFAREEGEPWLPPAERRRGEERRAQPEVPFQSLLLFLGALSHLLSKGGELIMGQGCPCRISENGPPVISVKGLSGFQGNHT